MTVIVCLQIACWGNGDQGRLGLAAAGGSSVPMSCWRPHECLFHWRSLWRALTTAAVAEDGSAYLWGLNDRGQLAQGDETPFLQVLVSPSEGLIATHPMCGQDRAACRVNNAQCHPVHHRMVHHSVAGEQR